MNCSIFRKKMNDLLEGNTSSDIKEALEHHTEECHECREIYDREVLIDKAFKDAFSIKDVSFVSSRAEIMKSIDKNRYGKGAAKKVYFHLKKYTTRYISCAALIVFTVIFAPYAMKIDHSPYDVSQNRANSVAKQSTSSVPQVMMKSTKMENVQKTAMNTVVNTPPVFEKVGVNPKEKNPESSTPWLSSPSKKLSICIEGRGAEAKDEGVGVIYVKNIASGAVWMMSNVSGDEKYTPIHLDWWDDENVLVIMGYPYGTMSNGGNLYLLNIETAAVSPVYTLDNDKIQVTNAKKLGSKVQLQLVVFDDENYSKSHSEERFCETDMNSLVKANSQDLYVPELKAIYDFEKLVNSKDYNGAMALLSPSLKGAYTMDDEKPLKNITSMNIVKLVEEPKWNVDRVEETYYAHKVYYAEVYYTVENENYSYIKNGVYYHKIVIVKEKKDSPWSIAEMSTSPPQ